jgi:hypothetical protein
MGLLRFMLTTSPPRSLPVTSGRYLLGSVSSCSRNTPSAEILPVTWRSAEHDTPIPTYSRVKQGPVTEDKRWSCHVGPYSRALTAVLMSAYNFLFVSNLLLICPNINYQKIFFFINLNFEYICMYLYSLSKNQKNHVFFFVFFLIRSICTRNLN